MVQVDSSCTRACQCHPADSAAGKPGSAAENSQSRKRRKEERGAVCNWDCSSSRMESCWSPPPTSLHTHHSLPLFPMDDSSGLLSAASLLGLTGCDPGEESWFPTCSGAPLLPPLPPAFQDLPWLEESTSLHNLTDSTLNSTELENHQWAEEGSLPSLIPSSPSHTLASSFV